MIAKKYTITSQLRRAASITFIIQVVSSVSTLIISILLTHWLGPKEFGVYSYVLALTGLVGTVGALGFPTLLVRQIAAWQGTSNWRLIKGLIIHSSTLTLLASSMLGFIVLIIGLRLGKISRNFGFGIDLMLAIILIIFMIQGQILTSALQGLNKVVNSLIPGSLGVPVVFLGCLPLIYWWKGSIDVPMILSLQIVLAIAFIMAQVTQLFRALPPQFFIAPIHVQFPTWLYNAFPFLMNGALTTINLRADVFLIGLLKGPTSAGVYNAATRGALVLVLALSAIVTASQPTIARLYSEGDRPRLQQLLTITSRFGFIISLIGCIILVAFRRILLGTLFGPAFTYGGTALAILSMARVVNAGTGSLGPFLAMTNQAKVLSFALAAEAILNVIFNYFLIPEMGINGSALATGGSMALVNIIVAIWVYRYSGYDVSFLGFRNRQTCLKYTGESNDNAEN